MHATRVQLFDRTRSADFHRPVHQHTEIGEPAMSGPTTSTPTSVHPLGAIPIRRHRGIRLTPDPRRVILKPFIPGEAMFADGTSRVSAILRRILAMSDDDVATTLLAAQREFAGRHRDLDAILATHFDAVAERTAVPDGLSPSRCLLIGAYFSNEYSVEATALGNPSIVLSPRRCDGQNRSSRPGPCTAPSHRLPRALWLQRRGSHGQRHAGHAYDRGSMAELIEDGRSGYLVNDIAGAANAVALVGELDRGALRASAVARFSVATMVDKYVAVYQAALASNGGGRAAAGTVGLTTTD